MSTSPQVTLTGKLFDSGGNAVVGGTVTLTLVNYGSNLPLVTGTGIFAATTLQTSSASDGTFSLGPFFGNYQIAPSGTYYTLTVSQNQYTTSNIDTPYQFNNSGTFDLSTLTPVVSYATPIAVSELSTVAVTGSFTDLLNIPTLTNTVFGRHGTVTAHTGDYSIGQISGAATVASTGSYNDLLNIPVFTAETPSGSYPGTVYTLAHSATTMLGLFLNGMLLYPSIDYTLVGSTLTLMNATSGTDLLHAVYIR